MKALVLGAFFLAASAIPSRAASVTIDSSAGCSTCFGLSWTLTVNTGSYVYGGSSYAYQAILDVVDDPAIAGTPSDVIAAVSFKASSTVSGAVLYVAPTSGWTTSQGRSVDAGDCNTSGSGSVCSQSWTTAGYSPLRTWGWYFNTDTPLPNVNQAQIGAKFGPQGPQPGTFMLETARVPEPASLSLIGAGALGLATLLARRRRSARR